MLRQFTRCPGIFIPMMKKRKVVLTADASKFDSPAPIIIASVQTEGTLCLNIDFRPKLFLEFLLFILTQRIFLHLENYNFCHSDYLLYVRV